MKAVVYNFSFPKYLLAKACGKFYPDIYYGKLSCLKLTDLPEPTLREDWAKIKTIHSGICGSDMGTILFKLSPALTPFASFPSVLGHEIVGKIVETGDRVVIDPFITCKVRNIHPQCKPCQEGNYSLCRNAAGDTKMSAGMIMGSCRDEPGGWAEYLLAHKSQIIKVPDNISDSKAVLVEPLSVGLHAVLKRPPEEGSKVLVIGGGMMSYSIIVALELLEVDCHITQLALFKYQTDMGLSLGANNSICKGDNIREKVCQITGARSYKPIFGDYVYTGGFDYVYDCVGSPESLKDAMRFTREKGVLIIVGASAQIPNIDLTFIWQKELNIIGSLGLGYEVYNGRRVRTFELLMELLQRASLPVERLVTHRFDLTQYREAIVANIERKLFKSIKTIFDFTRG